MKIGLSFVALAGAAALALGVGAAQAHLGKSQALEAKMRPGWGGGSCKRMFDGRERCVEIGPRDELVVRWSGLR